MATLLLLNKPFNVLSQFTDAEGRTTLAEFITTPDVYAAGRLDYDSEGLLLLTGDGALQHRIASPSQKLPKTYWAQVEGIPTEQALDKLRQGISLKDGRCRPAKVKVIEEPPSLWERTPPVRVRQTVPDTWLELTITEGRNRQVRRMTAAIGHPTLRLVRAAIGPWRLDGLLPGQYRTEEVHLPAGGNSSNTPGRGKNGNRHTKNLPPTKPRPPRNRQR